MNLITTLRNDSITAFKSGHKIKTALLRTLIAEACKKDKEPEDAAVISVINKFISNAKEVHDVYISKDDIDNAAKAQSEIDILTSYKPTQLNTEEMTSIVSDLIRVHQMKSIGAIMNHFKTTYAGMYNGNELSSIVKSALASEVFW
jgi:uncharacterized protein